ncbi:hypothetical protein GGX14DRAFT_561598 [Mycena pura]|uniref:Uncharacterized protein n=1 Tax=Mycena pura TaxID=153505 RepID=A0AAD6VLX9_9AGAR|nr:hypothetical protein GGX14DRAFT_561598 [Mycena pura]
MSRASVQGNPSHALSPSRRPPATHSCSISCVKTTSCRAVFLLVNDSVKSLPDAFCCNRMLQDLPPLLPRLTAFRPEFHSLCCILLRSFVNPSAHALHVHLPNRLTPSPAFVVAHEQVTGVRIREQAAEGLDETALPDLIAEVRLAEDGYIVLAFVLALLQWGRRRAGIGGNDEEVKVAVRCVGPPESGSDEIDAVDFGYLMTNESRATWSVA